MHPSELWNGTTIGARLARIALSPFSILYGMGWEVYLSVYRLGFKKASEPHIPVLCVGNLISGGGGKSPVTIHLAKLLQSMDREVVIGVSGYGSPRSHAASLAPTGPLDPKEWGDEPAMIRSVLPGVPLIVGRRRVLAAEICESDFPNAVLLMDDGFQHLPVKKHLTILLDPEKPQNRLCLPAGPYREPRWNRARADLVLPGDFRVETSNLRFELLDGSPTSARTGSALCAIARPERYFADLATAGVTVMNSRSLPDHDPLDAGTLLEGMPPDYPIFVTAKDWVKLKASQRSDLDRFIIAYQEITIEPAIEFASWLRSHLSG